MRHRRAARLRLECLEDRCTPAALLASFAEDVVAAGVVNATAMEFAPDGDLWVLEQDGAVKRFAPGGTTADVVADVNALGLNSVGERGLLGITFSPTFAADRQLYLYYTSTQSPTPHNRVSAFTVDTANPADYSLVDTGTNPAIYDERIVLDLEGLTASNHNGGAIHFGPDGKLYVATGENNVPANAQSLTTRLGKILRLNTDGSIPSDNPTTIAGLGATAGVYRSIWAAGLRNPYTFTFQPGTGTMFINDVGQGAFEEVNVGGAGRNYGWGLTEGDFDQASFPNFTRPLYAYSHGSGTFQGFAITGGAFYNPTTNTFPPEYGGDYFFADFVNDWINVIDPNTKEVRRFATNAGGPVDLKAGSDGSLYYLSRNAGQVLRIRYAPLVVPPGVDPAVFAPGDARRPVSVFDPTTGVRRTTAAPFAGFPGEVRVATGDVDHDGTADLIYAAGRGGGPRVQVVSGRTGFVLRDFYAYEPNFDGGVFVAAGDVNGDGFADIAVGAGQGGGPRVRVFSGQTGTILADFYAYEPQYGGGVTVALADLNGDTLADLAVGTGVGGGPRVRVFSAANPNAVLADFFAYEPNFGGGIYVAAGNVLAGGGAALIVGTGVGGGPRVRVFAAGSYAVVRDFYAYDPSFPGGVRVGVGSVGGNGKLAVLTGPGPGGGPHAQAFDVTTGVTTLASFFAADPGFNGGITVG